MPPGIQSRHLYTSGRKRDGSEKLFLTPRVPYRYRDLEDNRVHIVSEGDSLHKLAAVYFAPLSALPTISAANLWWVIADFQPQPIQDPTIKLIPGQRLTIPSVRAVIENVLGRNGEF